MKKIVGFGVCLLLTVLVISGCGFGGDSKNSNKMLDGEDEKYLNLVIASEPPSLDPALATDSVSVGILTNSFEGLTRINYKNEVENGAAEKIDVSEDGKTYTFTLRDAKWSNGDKLTASDFEYAWKRALDPETMSEYAANMYVIKGAQEYNTKNGKVEDVAITAKDDNTLVVELNYPTAYFNQLTSTQTYLPVNQKVVEADKDWATNGGDKYVSNGAFEMSAWKHNDSITLSKNDNYWGNQDVKLDKVEIKMVEDESTSNKMYQAGEIDFLGAPFQNIPLDAIDDYKSSGELNAPNYAHSYYYKVNTTKDFVSNKNIRKALALAIDRENIVENITKAGQLVATGIVPPAIPGYEDHREFFKDNDIEEAKVYLKKGMEELNIQEPSDITVDISINTSEVHAAIAQVIQESWHKNLGITTNIDNADWKVFLDKVSSLEYPGVARMGWYADYLDPFTYLEMYETNNGNNQTGWSNTEYDALLQQSREEIDTTKRLEVLKKAEDILMDELPILPVYYNVDANVVKEYVTNLKPTGNGLIDFKLIDVQR